MTVGDAQLCALIANVHTDAKRRLKAWSPIDFLPRREEEKPSDGYVAPEDMLKMIDDLMAQQERRKEIERRRALLNKPNGAG